MAIDIFKTVEVIEVMENFLERIRPPEHVRNELDIGYNIEDQSVIVFEIRPRWNNPAKLMESPVAKATFVKSKNCWKVFWMRSDLRWHSYPPCPVVQQLLEFCKLVEEDKHNCFWG